MILSFLMALALAAPPTAPPIDPQDERARQALLDLSAGRPAQAALAFESILDANPDRVDALDGLIHARLAMGDAEGACRIVDARLARRPDDAAFARWRLSLLGRAPSRRSEAIDGLTALVAAEPEDVDAWRELALYLSWTPGQLTPAIEAWRRAHALAPEDAATRVSLARTLAWAGENDASRAIYDQLLLEQPEHLDALLGRAQLARWTAHLGAARQYLARARKVAPEDPRLLAEMSRVYLDSGRVGAARRAADRAHTAAPGLYEADEARAAVRKAVAPEVGGRVTFTDETTGIRRLTVAAGVGLRPLPDTAVRVEPSFDQFSSHGTDTQSTADRFSVGVDVRQGGLPQGLYARAGYRLGVWTAGDLTHQGAAELGAARPGDLPLWLHVGARHRLLTDARVDERERLPLMLSGSGGATWAGVVDRVGIDEVYAGVAAAPSPGMYLYGDGAYGRVPGNIQRPPGLGDMPAVVEENVRWSIAAGGGQDVLRLFGVRGHALTVRYDLYALSVTAEDVRYYSPSLHLSHTPGLAWAWSPGVISLGVEAGVPLRADAPVGWLAGAQVGVQAGDHLEIAARFKATDDTAWRALGGTLSVTGRW
jgi:tetratricopeptide (TPR) repeat protein